MKRMLLVSRAGQTFGLELEWVRELAAFEGLTPVPAIPRLFAGVMVLRGEMVAAVDLPLLWREESGRIESVTRVVIVGGERPEFALLAEAAEELRVLDEDHLEPAPGPFEHCGFVRGVSRDGIIVLEGGALLQDKRIYA
jgi:purine-binding chemotaxis protein CheW